MIKFAYRIGKNQLFKGYPSEPTDNWIYNIYPCLVNDAGVVEKVSKYPGGCRTLTSREGIIRELALYQEAAHQPVFNHDKYSHWDYVFNDWDNNSDYWNDENLAGLCQEIEKELKTVE